MTREEFNRILAKPAVARANPHLVGALEADRAQRPTVQALVPGVQKPACGTSGLAIRVTLIACRHRLLDAHDAVEYADKPLVDAIAATLGLDDADPAITWEYGQVRTSGEEGVIVKIETRFPGPIPGRAT